jgi:hypothetical protein
MSPLTLWEVKKVRISSLPAFVVLGAVSATDVGTSAYHDSSHAASQLANRPVEYGVGLASEGQNTLRDPAYDFVVAQSGQENIFSEIKQNLRELTRLGPCWHNGGQHHGLHGTIAKLCRAIAEPL